MRNRWKPSVRRFPEQHARLVRNNSSLASRTPLLTSIEGPYTESAEELAVRFHKEKKMSQFRAVAAKLNEEAAVNMARTFYASKEMDYFAVLADALPESEILDLSRRLIRVGMRMRLICWYRSCRRSRLRRWRSRLMRICGLMILKSRCFPCRLRSGLNGRRKPMRITSWRILWKRFRICRQISSVRGPTGFMPISVLNSLKRSQVR